MKSDAVKGLNGEKLAVRYEKTDAVHIGKGRYFPVVLTDTAGNEYRAATIARALLAHKHAVDNAVDGG